MRRCFNNSGRAVLDQYVLWYQVLRREAPRTFAFENGVVRFGFGAAPEQMKPDRDADVYDLLPYEIKPEVDADLAAEVRKYLISYYSGNKQAEMLERALEAIAFLGLSAGLDKVLVIKDDGRKQNGTQHIAQERLRHQGQPLERLHPHRRRRGTQADVLALVCETNGLRRI